MSGTTGSSGHRRLDSPERPFSALARVLSFLKIDFPTQRTRPGAGRWISASILAIAGSLAADALLVAIGTAIFPATKGYVHFRFSDYAKLTVIGVVIACIGWPVITSISFSPRRLFFRLATLVTLVLWLPDLWILAKGQPPKAVAVLMVMHLAIALVTFNALVHMAPARKPGAALVDSGHH